MLRERQGWIAAVAVLATSLGWLGALTVALLANAYAREWPDLLVVLRAVVKAARIVAEQGLPLALVSGFVAVVAVMGLTSPWGLAGARSRR